MSLFAFEHVSKRYSDGRRALIALDDVSFEVDERDFLGIWGMRRTGKSTLLRVAAGIERPSEGVVRFDGQDITRLSDDARAALLRGHGIGFVSSEWRHGSRQSAVTHVATSLLADSFTLAEARGAARECLERTGVLKCGELPIDRLSRGEFLRVELARALVHEPRLLLVDEPAVLIDPREREELYDLLGVIGCALIVVSEDVAVIRIARRRMTIGKGTLRSMDEEGQLVPFPRGRASAGQTT
jgi:ABC-type ATPase involved in cell division